MDALETLKATLDETKAKLDAKEQQLHERDQTIRELRASGARLIDSPTTPRLPLGASAPLTRRAKASASPVKQTSVACDTSPARRPAR